VAEALAAAGVPPEAITVAVHGEDPAGLPVPTPDGVPEPLNRCVEIRIVPDAA
jgi:outer membrane protein OmpA-like peptidoglycan-associated protein